MRSLRNGTKSLKGGDKTYEWKPEDDVGRCWGGSRRTEVKGGNGEPSFFPAAFSFRIAEVTFLVLVCQGLWGRCPSFFMLGCTSMWCPLRLFFTVQNGFSFFPQMFRSRLSESFLRVTFNRLVSFWNNKTLEVFRPAVVWLCALTFKIHAFLQWTVSPSTHRRYFALSMFLVSLKTLEIYFLAPLSVIRSLCSRISSNHHCCII